MSLKKILSPLAVLLSISGCTSNSQQVQVEDRQNMVYTRHGVMEVMRIYPGDTIESIALQKHIPVEILAAVNNIPYPYHLHNTRTLIIPQEKYHKVSKKETLKSIAKKYSVDVMQLMDVNDMTHVSQNKPLSLGTIIKIPNSHSYTSQHVQDVQEKESYTATKNYEVMELEEVKDSPIDDIESQENDLNNKEEIHNLEFEKDLQQTINSTPQPEIKAIENSTEFKTLTPLNSQQFIWPLSGTVKRDNKDGVIIFAPLNSAVKAAGSGKVIFAENDNGEYGNLIIIKHSDGYLSAYAHNNQLIVKKGDEVKKGQTIAKVGKSGNVSKPQLYFSMRKGKELINPETDVN